MSDEASLRKWLGRRNIETLTKASEVDLRIYPMLLKLGKAQTPSEVIDIFCETLAIQANMRHRRFNKETPEEISLMAEEGWLNVSYSPEDRGNAPDWEKSVDAHVRGRWFRIIKAALSARDEYREERREDGECPMKS